MRVGARVRIIARPSYVWPDSGMLGTVVEDVHRHNGCFEVRADGQETGSWPYFPDEIEEVVEKRCAGCQACWANQIDLDDPKLFGGSE